MTNNGIHIFIANEAWATYPELIKSQYKSPFCCSQFQADIF